MSTALPAHSEPWPAGRLLAAGTFAAVCVGLLAAAALYLASVLFLILNQADLRQARLTSIVDYWTLYRHDPHLRKQLIGSIAAAGVGLLVVLPLAAVGAAQRKRPLHGDARFATTAEVVASGLLPRRKAAGPSILIGRRHGNFLTLRGQLSVMLSAPTRSGKGVGVVIPNLLHWPDSVVVLDIKGENFAVTAGYRAACGQAVFAFSPFDEKGCSHRWNPLSSVRTGPLYRVGDLLSIGQVFYPNDGSGTSSEAFFNDQARNLFLGIGLYLLETPELPRTLGEMLRQSSGKGRPMKDHFTAEIEWRRADGHPLSDECVDALQRLLGNSENTLTSIVSTFNAPLTVFADAVVDAATSGDDFSLADLRRRRQSIYVRVPPHRLASARPVLNLFFSQLVSLNTACLPEHDPSLRLQCLLIMDEFAALGRVGVLSSAVAFLGGYNLRLLTVVQAMSQLDALYGEKEARTFATNHGVQILYAPREQRDAEEYSAMLGHFTERSVARGRSRSFGGHHGHSSVSRNDSDQRRALLLPQEFKELGPERLVVVAENYKPILGTKVRYHRERAFVARLRPAPRVAPMNVELHLAKAQGRWRLLPERIDADTSLDVDVLAQPFTQLPDPTPLKTRAELDGWVDAFFELTRAGAATAGGTVEPLSELEIEALDAAVA